MRLNSFMKVAVFGMSVLALPGVASSQDFATKLGLALCAKIAGDTARLKCFDEIVAGMKGAGTSTDAKGDPALPKGFDRLGVGSWLIKRDKSKVDDSPIVNVIVTAKEDSGRGAYGGQRWFALRCLENRTNAFVFWQNYLISGLKESATHRVRVDGSQPVTTTWQMSSNRQATGLWSGGSSIPFIKTLYGKSALIIEVAEDSGKHVAEFDISGIEDAASAVREACGW